MWVSEALINKKIIYSTKHITEMSITQAETIEETIADLILGMEESNKDTTESQAKVNSSNDITFQQANNNHQNNESEETGDTSICFTGSNLLEL